MNIFKRFRAAQTDHIGKVTTTMTGIKSATLEMVIVRADGTVEDRGVVAHTTFVQPNPLAKFIAKLTGGFK
jgi:hypothetical protein